MGDNIRELPNPARDEQIAAFAALARTLAIMVEHAGEIARAKKAMYLAYVEAGFTEAQALELAKQVLL